MRRPFSVVLLLSVVLLPEIVRLSSGAAFLYAQELAKKTEDTDRNATTVGAIGLTVTNFGTIGSRNAYWPSQPSCEYPRGSRVEHMYQGALWVGALSRKTGQIHVSTGSSDRVSTTTGKGMEFMSLSGSDMVQRSTLSESPYFSPNAVSHQDFVALYMTPSCVTVPRRTRPFRSACTVRQESYAWNFPFADFFVILNYTIYNTGADTLDSVYVGLWTNNVVRNTNNVRPGTPGYFTHGGNGYMDTTRIGYTFDYDGIPTPPAADSYIGIKLLGTYPFPRGVDSVGSLRARTYYNAWRFSSSSGDADYFSPQDDAENILGARSRYERLAGIASAEQDRSAPDPARQHDHDALDGSVRHAASRRFPACGLRRRLCAQGRNRGRPTGYAGPAQDTPFECRALPAGLRRRGPEREQYPGCR